MTAHWISASDGAKRAFDVPEGAAEVSLRRFSEQAGIHVIFPPELTEGIRTNAIKGSYTPAEAADRLLAGTSLRLVLDEATGVYAVRKTTQGNPAPRALSPPAANPALSADSGMGVIMGRVRNEVTSAFLAGARVEAIGTGRFTLTGRDGYFALNVPAGEILLSVSYTGLETQRISLQVPAGGSLLQDLALTSDAYTLDTFMVEGPREGAALAITQQKEAPNVKNVVATDAFGNIADGNVGDFLLRLPGIAGVYDGMDVRSVQIRGIGADLNTVTMDGEQVATAQSANFGRAFEFEQASLGLIESIEVTKAPTPDMPANSIGGNVNLVTKSAFDRAYPQYFAYTIGGVYRPRYGTPGHWAKEPIDGIGPSLNFIYSNVYGPNQNLGVVLTATYHSQPGGDTASIQNYEKTMNRPAYVYQVAAPRPAGPPRSRLATGAKIDYKFSENTVITLNTVYNWFHESNDTRQFQLTTSAAVAVLNANGVPTGNGTIMPGYTETFTQVRQHNNSQAVMTLTSNDKSGRTVQLNPSVRHRFPTVNIDYSASWSNSRTYYENGPYGGRHVKSRPKGQIVARLRNIGWNVDRSRDIYWPVYTQTAGLDMYDLNNYTGLQTTWLDREGEDEVLSARFNLHKEFSIAVPAYIKTGFNVVQQDRATVGNYRRFSYLGGPFGHFIDTTGRHGGANHGYRQPAWPNPFAVAKDPGLNPELWQEDHAYSISQRAQWNRKITEIVSAVYLMGGVTIDRVSILGGFRVEDTRTDGEGPLQEVSDEESARRAAWGTAPLTEEEIIRRNTVEWSGRMQAKGQYRNVFPSVHFKYSPRGNLVMRASYSNGIGRPPYGSIIPLNNANHEAETLTINNPALKPQYSDNFDVTAEYYFEPVGMVSAGVFLKELSSFIYQDRSQRVGYGADNGFGGLYENYEIITSSNGGAARYRGVELAYQQQFTFLPGFWRGFGLNLNYTYLETEGDYGGASVTSEVAGMVPKMANASVTYNTSKWNLRVQLNWVGKTLNTIATNPAGVIYREPKTLVNLKMKYTVSRKLAFFCDVENVFSEPITSNYYAYEDRPQQYRLSTPKIIGGIQGRF